MSQYLITLRCHQNDTQLFEDYMVLIKGWLKNEIKRYSWSIEFDETINRHIHLLIQGDYRDSDKVRRRLTTKEFKSIQINLNKSKTILANALRIDKVKEMPQKALGYTQKWSCQRRDHLGFTDQEIVDAVEFYYTTSRLEKSQVISNDWKHVNSKNFHAIVTDYAKKNDLNLKDSDIICLHMQSNYHTFIGMSIKDMERGFKELRLTHKCSSQADEYSASQQAHAQEKSYDMYMEDDIKDLLSYIKSLKDTNIKLNIPMNVFNIHKKYDY